MYSSVLFLIPDFEAVCKVFWGKKYWKLLKFLFNFILQRIISGLIDASSEQNQA